MKLNKVQTLEIVKANATAPGRYTFSTNLDADFEDVDGFYLLNTSNGGDDRYRISIADDSKVHFDLVNHRYLLSDGGVAPKDRWIKDYQMKARNRRVTVTIEVTKTLTSELRAELLFNLVKDAPAPPLRGTQGASQGRNDK